MGRPGVPLPPSMIRTIWRLRRKGLTVKDIAHQTGISEGSIVRHCRNGGVDRPLNVRRESDPVSGGEPGGIGKPLVLRRAGKRVSSTSDATG